jgi:hypothetical protein
MTETWLVSDRYRVEVPTHGRVRLRKVGGNASA